MVGDYLLVQGAKTLEGRVRVPAAKNSVLPLLAAALMCSGESYFTAVPDLADVRQSVLILQALGCRCQRRGRGMAVQPGGMAAGSLPEEPAKAMRSSVFYLAPALHRFGRVQMPLPGGCRLGARPIDIHLDGLGRMGAKISWQGPVLTLEAEKGLQGVDYTLRLPSVGATETLLMAAVKAKGTTILRGAAKEPEIVDLAGYLRRCGAKISGEGTSVILIRGVNCLKGAVHTPIPDRILTATMACAVACAGGRIELMGARPQLLLKTLEILSKAGCTVEKTSGGLVIERSRRLRAAGELYTGAYPGFSTDAAPLVAAAMLTAVGKTIIEDRIFENRFSCAEGFCAMGAAAKKAGRSIGINGRYLLHGADVYGQDLRGTAALLIAALGAQGESRIYGLEHLCRGYEKIETVLLALGAQIRREHSK